MVVSDIEAAATAVHDELGAGFTEAVYHSAMIVELSERGIKTSTETTIPIFYRGNPVGRRRPDLIVEDDDTTVVIELKAGSNSGEAQLLQYLDLLGEDSNFTISKGVLIQFNDDVEVTTKDV